MPLKIAKVHKSLVTSWAAVPLLPSVSLHVHVQCHPVFELLPTQSAAVRLLSCVHAHVSCTVRLGQKTLATDLAGEWLLPCVDELVLGKSEVVDKTFAAFRALMLLLLGVDLDMPVQASHTWERFPTFVT